MLFRELNTAEVQSFEEWATVNHAPGMQIDPLWHPVIRQRCAMIDKEAGRDGDPFFILSCRVVVEASAYHFIDPHTGLIQWGEELEDPGELWEDVPEVDEEGEPVPFDGPMILDFFTASNMLAIWDALGEGNRAKWAKYPAYAAIRLGWRVRGESNGR